MYPNIFSLLFALTPAVLSIDTPSRLDTIDLETFTHYLNNSLSESEYIYGVIRGSFGRSPWLDEHSINNIHNSTTVLRQGRKLGATKGSRLWPNARVPYEFASTIDHSEWQIMQNVFSNISSVTNIEFIPR